MRRCFEISCGSVLACVATASSVFASATAIAQTVTQPVATESLEEITVTARRRMERIQDVPASITVLDTQTIQSGGIRSFTDIPKLIPNLSLFTNYRAGQPFITMRGIPTVQGGEPPVTVLVDGVQVPGLEFVSQDLLDVANIQVLRGPQGALYGRGAVAGAVLIETRKPGNEFESRLRAFYGNEQTYSASGTASGPIAADKVWFRATASYRDSDGFNPNDTTGENADASREFTARAELLAQPTDDLALSLRGTYTDGTDGASYYSLVSNAQLSDFSIHAASNFPIVDQRKLQSVSFKADWETPVGTVTSISQYAKTTSDVLGDADFGPLAIAQQIQHVDVRAFNQDLRLSSANTGPMQWIVGAFFQHRRSLLDLLVGSQPGGILPPGLVFLASDQDDLSRAWAAYAQGSYKFGDSYELSVALRYDEDHRESEDKSVADSAISHTFTAVQPQVTLNKRFSEGFLGYVTIGRGFRSGGFNPLADAQISGVARMYPKETTTNYELGVKSEWLDSRLVVNASVFRMDFDNQQFFIVNVNPPYRDIIFFPKSKVTGGELEIFLRPVEGMTLSGGVGISDAIIDDFNGTGENDGNHSPLSNQFTSNVTVEYQHPITAGLKGLARADYNGAGRVYYDPANQYTFGRVHTIAARIGIETDRWSLFAVGKNLTDERFPALVAPNAFAPDVNGRIPNLPRTYGIELIANF